MCFSHGFSDTFSGVQTTQMCPKRVRQGKNALGGIVVSVFRLHLGFFSIDFRRTVSGFPAGPEPFSENVKMTKSMRLSIRPAMLALALVAIALSAIHPYSAGVWMTEIFWAVGLLAVLLILWPRFRFSSPACAFFLAWILLQAIGAHYSFERVPMDWLTGPLRLARNPYDRIAHFVVGTFAFPFAELFGRRHWVRTPLLAAFFAVMTTVAMAGLWEIVEWLYAAIEGGDLGAAFLGSQGDVWDAQKDILCDTLGALSASLLFLLRPRIRRSLARRRPR